MKHAIIEKIVTLTSRIRGSTVDAIVSNIAAQVERLHKLAGAEFNRADLHYGHADWHEAQAEDAKRRAQHARRVAEKLQTLIV